MGKLRAKTVPHRQLMRDTDALSELLADAVDALQEATRRERTLAAGEAADRADLPRSRKGPLMPSMNQLLPGASYTVDGVKQLRENANLSPAQLRVVDQFIAAAERHAETHHNNAIRTANEDLVQRHDAIDDQRIRVADDIRKTRGALRRGRITSAEARKRLAKAGLEIRDLRERAEALARDEEALQELAGMSALDWQAQLVKTYPALAQRLPMLRPSDLNL